MTTHGKYCDFDFYVTSLDTVYGKIEMQKKGSKSA